MNAKRVAALVALGLGILAVAVVLLGSGGSPYKVTVRLDNSSQLIKGNDVRIGAVNVGTVTDINLADDGTAEVDLEINEDTAPLMQGTTVAVRSTSVLGLANRYVVVQPPPGEAEPLPDGSTIGVAGSTSIVEVDALFDTLNARTRKGLQELVRGGATVLDGRSQEVNETISWLGPTFGATSELMGELAKDQDAFAGLLGKAARTARAMNSRRADLVELISAANATTGAIGDEAVALDSALGQLPDTLRRSNTSFVELRGAMDELDEFVAVAKPTTKDLAPFLRKLAPFTKRARKTVPDAAAIVDKKGKRNDLTDIFKTTPALSKTASTAFPSLAAFMGDSEDTIDLLRAYTPDIFGAISNIGQLAGTYDANGHYLRGLPVLGAVAYNSGPNEIVPQPPANRLGGFELGAGARCPGGAMQAPFDGSAPVVVPGCNPLLLPPGP